MSDHRTESVMTVNYAHLLKKHRRRALWLPLLFSAIGVLSAASKVNESGSSYWDLILTEAIIVGLAWCYYWAFTVRDVEQVKMSGAAALIDGMAEELGREWRWSKTFECFVLCDINEERSEDYED